MPIALSSPRNSLPSIKSANVDSLEQSVSRRLTLNLRLFAALVVAFSSGLCLYACAAEGEPNLKEVKAFRAYPVYYSGVSVAGNSLREIQGDPARHEDKRDTSWFFLYGQCKDPPDEGGCPVPIQIHSYSTCTRWASLRTSNLFDFRGAKATRPRPGGGAALEIFTGRTTVTIHAENRHVLDSAARALRDVRSNRPSALAPPAPGSLSGELPCQKE